jgi:ferredoxin
MGWPVVLGLFEAVLLGCFSLVACLTPWCQGERSAARRALLLIVPWPIGFALAFLLVLPLRPLLSLAVAGASLVVSGLLFIPGRRPQGIRILGPQPRVDERDLIFSRAHLRPGSERYRNYYARRPAFKEKDERWRTLPPLGTPGGRYFHPLLSRLPTACFSHLKALHPTVTGQVSSEQVKLPREEFTRLLKGVAHYLGVDLVGIAPLEEAYLYSHVGRGGDYGRPIELPHRWAVVLGVEMDWRAVQQAPTAISLSESARQYARVGQAALILAGWLRALGYPARAHIDGCYRLLVVPLAWEAGLGELGRLGCLLTPEFGPRVRWAAVSTDAPLQPDRPRAFGVQELCRRCRKCADSCPAGAIPSGEKELVRGVEKWVMDGDKCFFVWRKFGTDCGLCLRACPLSRPPLLWERLLRWALPRSAAARALFLAWDRLLYPARYTPLARPSDLPPWG